MGVNNYTNMYLCKSNGLLSLMHGVFSLPDATSYDKKVNFTKLFSFFMLNSTEHEIYPAQKCLKAIQMLSF